MKNSFKQKRWIIVALILFLINTKTIAQEVAFIVLGYKGKIMVDANAVKIGSMITNDQIIEVGVSSYLSLTNAEKKVIEITQVGKYAAKDLIGKMKNADGLTKKYLDFVVGELINVNAEGVSAKNKFNHMNKSGAIKRGGMITTILEKSSLEKYVCFGDVLEIEWILDNGNIQPAKYKIELSNLDKKKLWSKEVNSSNISINLLTENISKETAIACTIIPLDAQGKPLEKNEPSGIFITKVDEQQANSIKQELKNMNFNSPPTALERLIEARFFEDKQLYLDAIHAYKEAIAISGGVETYEDIYYKFLIRVIEHK